MMKGCLLLLGLTCLLFTKKAYGTRKSVPYIHDLAQEYLNVFDKVKENNNMIDKDKNHFEKINQDILERKLMAKSMEHVENVFKSTGNRDAIFKTLNGVAQDMRKGYVTKAMINMKSIYNFCNLNKIDVNDLVRYIFDFYMQQPIPGHLLSAMEYSGLDKSNVLNKFNEAVHSQQNHQGQSHYNKADIKKLLFERSRLVEELNGMMHNVRVTLVQLPKADTLLGRSFLAAQLRYLKEKVNKKILEIRKLFPTTPPLNDILRDEFQLTGEIPSHMNEYADLSSPTLGLDNAPPPIEGVEAVP